MSQITGSGFKSGAVGAGVNEAVQKELEKRFKNQPDMHQWASALIGAAAAKAVGGDAQTGASTAASGTKNNILAWAKPIIKPILKNIDRSFLKNNQYIAFSLDFGEAIQGRVGLILDKFGNVSEVEGLGGGVGLLPLSAGGTIGTVIDADGEDLTSEKMKAAIAGVSFTVGSQGLLIQGSGSVSLPNPSNTVTAEVGVASNIGVGAMVTGTKFIFNIDEDEDEDEDE